MKNLKYFLTIILISLSLNIFAVPRKVLVELSTQVYCTSCPKADSLIKLLMNTQFPNLTPIAYHVWPGGLYHDPFEEFNGKNIVFYLDPTGNIQAPGLHVDRTQMRCDYTMMADSIIYRYQTSPETPVEITVLTKNYNTASRQFDAQVKIKTYQSLQGNYNISFMIVENNRIYPQYTINGVVQNYVHDWVARNLVNNEKGSELIRNSWTANQEITKNFTTTIDTGWAAGNCDYLFVVYKVPEDTSTLYKAEIQQSEKGSVMGSVGVRNETSNVKSFVLYQNYPNPFNPITSIQFSIPKDDFVTLKVFDILGKELSTIYSGYLKGGLYNADFDGTNLSSGVYFYKLESKNFSSVKRMTLIK